jgi:uncharacterized heparinase superfamily protein
MTGPSAFTLLNRKFLLTNEKAWNDPNSDKLLLYTLHYHDDLTASGAAERVHWHRDLINRWIAENPPRQGNGWEPYTISLRIVNWIKWHLVTNGLSSQALSSLWVQASVLEQLLEYHLLGNHILANAKGLYFAASFFQGVVADRWRRKAESILDEQIAEQILDDGGHFELSPMYHSIILEDLLDIENIAGLYEFSVPARVTSSIDPMRRWLSTMTHPDGGVAHFNDSVGGNGPERAALEVYARQLGYDIGADAMSGTAVLADSGYVRMSDDAMTMLVDIGDVGPDYQPGHAHCDCLSFELSLGERRVLVNRGISTYKVGDQRSSERATNAHNTVAIDAAEQSEVWSAFRVGRRARPRDVQVSDNTITASHDGWTRLGLVHRREYRWRNSSVEIVDRLSSTKDASESGVANFHFHPDVHPILGAARVDFDGGCIEFEDADDIVVESYQYCQGFGDTVEASVLRIAFSTNLVSRITYANSVSH